MPNQQPTVVSARIHDPNYTPLHPHLTSPTFHRFRNLPLELQMDIFTVAAGHLSRTKTYEVFYIHRSRPRLGYLTILSPLSPRLSMNVVRIGAPRRRFMETCRLGRLMMLEQWRRDTVKVDNWVNGDLMTGWPADMTAMFLEVYLPKGRKVRGRMVDLIEEVKGWMEGRKEMIAMKQ